MSQVSYGTITINDLTDITDVYLEYALVNDTITRAEDIPSSTQWSTIYPTWEDGKQIWIRQVTCKEGIDEPEYGTPYLDKAVKQIITQIDSTQANLSALQSRLKKIWINEVTSGDYVAGTYAASGLGLTPDNFKINDPSTYGYNTLLRHNKLALRYNTIDMTTLSTNALTFYIPTQRSGNFVQGNKGLELTSEGLNLYQFSNEATDTPNLAAQLNVNGLKLLKGGIEGGTATSGNGYIYLSTADKGSVVSSLVPTPSGGTPKTDWRAIIGSKFGVDSEGNLYAAGANIEGAITATSLTISSGGTTYSGVSAINASGYTIEIINDASAVYSGATMGDNNTYLYPILYLNGIKVTTGIVYTNFIWYLDGATTGGTQGHSSNGGVVAEYGHTYRVTYSVDDTAVGEAQPSTYINVDPSKYITRIADNGITVHPETMAANSNYIHIDGNSLMVKRQVGATAAVNTDTVLANFGITVTIGESSGKNVFIDSSGIQLKNSSTTIANFGSTITIGESDNNNVFIDSNGISIRDNSTSLASFTVTGAQIGQIDESHLELDYHSMQLLDEYDNAYFYVSDLRDSDGNIRNTFTGDGVTTTFILPYYVGNYVNPYNFYVKVNGNTVLRSDYNIHADETNLTYYIVFQNAPASNSEIEIVYTNADYKFKSYTLGYRLANKPIGKLSVAEGDSIIATGDTSHAEGKSTTASGTSSHAEGNAATANGYASHAEGNYTTASGDAAHAEGSRTIAEAFCGHAEGYETQALYEVSHAEGNGCIAHYFSHAEGNYTTASGHTSHSEGHSTVAVGDYSHSQNCGTIAQRRSQTVVGEYNLEDNQGSDESERGNYAFIIGNGTADDARSNALTVDWSGNVVASGSVSSKAEQFSVTLPSTVTAAVNVYRKAGVVSITVTNPTKVPAGGTTWFTLPEGWRPPNSCVFMLNAPSSTGVTSQTLRMTVSYTGEVSVYNHSSAINANTNISQTCTFVTA